MAKNKTTIKGTLGAPVRGLLAGMAVLIASGGAWDAWASLNPNLKERILRKAERVNRLAQTNIDTLDNQEGRQLVDALNQALQILRDQDIDPNPNPNPNPHPNPNPYPNPGPFPPPHPHPLPGQEAYVVRARLSNLDVSFDGIGLEALFQQCRAYAQNFGAITRIQVNGATIDSGWTAFTADRACAILAVNATALSSWANVELNAAVQNIPVRLKVTSVIELQQAVATLIPRLIGNTAVTEVTINGKRYQSGWTAFSTQTVVGLLKWNTRDPLGYYVAEGDLQGALPFIITGTLPSEIESKCLAFVQETAQNRAITTITVNGQRRDSGWSAFTPAQICMAVKTLARPNH